MSQLLDTAYTILAADPPVPEYTPTLPGPLGKASSTILGWAAGTGLALATLGGLAGWGCVAIGHNTERAGLAARGKQAIIWSLVSGGGIGVTAALVMAFYDMTKS
ncbi:hypothetical protein [Streptomyces sp. NPDC054901]